MGCGLDGFGRSWLKLKSRLHTRLVACCHKDALDAPAAQLRVLGLQRVFAGMQPGESICPIPGGDRPEFFACSLVANDHCNAVQRRGVQIGEPARKRSDSTRLPMGKLRSEERRVGK